MRRKSVALLLSLFSRVQLLTTPWTQANQIPLPMGFSKQEYWSRLPYPSPRDLLNSRVKTMHQIKVTQLGLKEHPNKLADIIREVVCSVL